MRIHVFYYFLKFCILKYETKSGSETESLNHSFNLLIDSETKLKWLFMDDSLNHWLGLFETESSVSPTSLWAVVLQEKCFHVTCVSPLQFRDVLSWCSSSSRALSDILIRHRDPERPPRACKTRHCHINILRKNTNSEEKHLTRSLLINVSHKLSCFLQFIYKHTAMNPFLKTAMMHLHSSAS